LFTFCANNKLLSVPKSELCFICVRGRCWGILLNEHYKIQGKEQEPTWPIIGYLYYTENNFFTLWLFILPPGIVNIKAASLLETGLLRPA